MKAVLLDDAARADIGEACEWYESRRSGLSADLLSEIELAIQMIAELPNSFPIVGHSARRVLLRRFPYLVLFTVGNGTIGVIGLFHTARSPSTWLRRVAQRDNN